MKLLELTDASLETHVAQLGMGLEALGYKLALEAGISRDKANRESFRNRLLRIMANLPFALPFDAESCAAALSDAYNGVKHANRDMPGTQDLLRANRMGIQLFRCWVMA